MADFKQGDVVCLNSDLEHKFTVHGYNLCRLPNNPPKR